MKLEPPSQPDRPSSSPQSLEDAADTGSPSSASKKSGLSLLLWRVLAVVWVVLVLAGWFVIHRPFTLDVPYLPFSPEVPLALGRTLAAVIFLGLIILASGLVGGWTVAKLVDITRLTRLEQVLFSIGLGLGINGLLMLVGGLVGLVNVFFAYSLLGLELAINWKILGRGIRHFKNWRTDFKDFANGAGWLKYYLAFVAIVTLLLSLAPPIAWDAQLYHLTVPRLYIEAGKVGPQHDQVFSNYPFGVEMLYTWGMLLVGDGLAQAVHWAFGMAGAVAVYSFARRFFGSASNDKTPLLAASLYLSIPLVQTLMSWAYTDLAVGFYIFLAFYVLLLPFKLPDTKLNGLIVLAGLFNGLAFGGKYTSLLYTPALIAVLGLCAISSRWGWRKFLTATALAGLSTFALMLPWLLRNLFFSDNPIAPLLFGARGWDKAELAHYTGSTGFSQFSPLDLLTLPWSLVVQGTTGGPHDATVSPLFLALAPLILLFVWRDRYKPLFSREVALAFGVSYLVWLVTVIVSPISSQTRMLLPVFPLLALLAAQTLVRLPGLKAGLLRPVMALGLALYLAVNVLSLGLSLLAFDPLPVLAGLKSRDAYLEENLGPYYRAARFINNTLPANAYVHAFFEPRGYYINPRFFPDNDLNQFFYYFERYPDPTSFNRVLKERGATHILISERGENFLLNTPEYGQSLVLKKAQPLLNTLETQDWKLVYREEGQFAVYEIK